MSEPIRPDQDGRFHQACLALTRSQVKALVETYLAVEERRGKLYAMAARETGTAPGVVSLFHSVTQDLCPTLAALQQACQTYSSISPATHWVSEIPPLGPIVGAGLGAAFAGTEIQDTEHLLRLCELHPAACTMSPMEAGRLYQRFFRDSLSVAHQDLKAMAAATGRALRHSWNGVEAVPRADILDWLTRPVSSEFLQRLMRRAGDALAKQKGQFDNRFSRSYHMRLAQEHRLNQTEFYNAKAQRELRRGMGRTQGDLETYKRGRLPGWQLEDLAKRWVLRQFLTEFHQRLQTSGSLGIECPEEP